MGDRGFVRINGIGIYTHWGATELEETIARALAKRMRWNDHGYLAHIIFDEMNRYTIGKETGIGIYPEDQDLGSWKIIEILDNYKIRVKILDTIYKDKKLYERWQITFQSNYVEFIRKFHKDYDPEHEELWYNNILCPICNRMIEDPKKYRACETGLSYCSLECAERHVNEQGGEY